MGESFWQNNSRVTHILFELQSIILFSPVANFGHHPLYTECQILKSLQGIKGPMRKTRAHQ